nr:MAG TPA: hypothetical protein [Caudoviricetes sp.]
MLRLGMKHTLSSLKSLSREGPPLNQSFNGRASCLPCSQTRQNMDDLPVNVI